MKVLVFFHKDECDLVTGIKLIRFQWSGNVVWCISNEKYFHHFSNSYFELYFLLYFGENVMLFRAKLTIMYYYISSTADKPYESIGFFDEIMQKI